MGLSERLMRLQRMGLHKGTDKLRPTAPPAPGSGIDQEIAGQWIRTPHGNCFLVQTTHSLQQKHGGLPLGECLTLPAGSLAACGRDPLLAQLDLRRAAFVDTETSGLAGGTGTFAFLLGIGTFDDVGFTVSQFFMQSPAAEKALLHAASELLDRCTGLVSYNGRAFDLPLMNTRFLLNHQLPCLRDAPHLDLLFPVRRVWRARLGSCTLGNVEKEALGVHRQELDVPGWLVPALYRDFLRTGSAVELRRVFYHNLEDILSLVTLVARLCRLFVSSQVPITVLDELPAIDRSSLGRVYEQLGWLGASEEAYRRALEASLPPEDRDIALGRLALLLKRQQRREDAARVWQLWSEEASDSRLTPFIELAKHHEWHTRDLSSAADWTRQALQRAESWPQSPQRSAILSEVQHRLNRLQRKLVRDAEV